MGRVGFVGLNFDIDVGALREIANGPVEIVDELAGAEGLPGSLGGKGGQFGDLIALNDDVLHGRSLVEHILVLVLHIESGAGGKLAHRERDVERDGTVSGRSETVPNVIVGIVALVSIAGGVGAGDGAFVGNAVVIVNVEIACDLLGSVDAQVGGVRAQAGEGDLDGTHRGLERIGGVFVVQTSDQGEILERVFAGGVVVVLVRTVNIDEAGSIDADLTIDECRVVRVDCQVDKLETILDFTHENGGRAIFLGSEREDLSVFRRLIVSEDVDIVTRLPGELLEIGIGGTGVIADGGGDGVLMERCRVFRRSDRRFDFLVAGDGKDAKEREGGDKDSLHDLHSLQVIH